MGVRHFVTIDKSGRLVVPKALRDELITLQGWDGYALDIEDAAGAVVMMRTYIVKDRLFRLLVTATSDVASKSAATRFLDSLRLAETRQP